MRLVEQVETEAEKRAEELESDVEFLELRLFYEEMLACGLAIKRPYDIPLLDTIGRSVYVADSIKNAR